jgi:aspartyl-tRNA(Asn)/glutamyl-tRNA(Gln) amidotransferase subunit C
MAASLTQADVEAIAALAQLELEPAERDLFVRQLGEILDYATEVQQIDTSGVPPTASVVTGHEADRPDHVLPCLDRAEALANAPDAALQAGLFKVPRVIG